MKMIATAAVIFPRKVPAPLEPKTVWLDPPKAAPMLAPLPACSKTIRTRVIQAKTWIMVNNVVIFISLFLLPSTIAVISPADDLFNASFASGSVMTVS